ncbi:hypothetical protein ACH5RR_039518 [Cinchona calisaya]|uniref:Non-haem dioxygenase N-terminal domain-containing protein n=1 Tax=Cinchona calisaya TaxID=153742 RepID=A0ABD2Y3P1_9GENT
MDRMKVVIEEFFKLPLQQKMAYAQLPNSLEGYGQAFVVSEDRKLDWGDMLFLYALPVSQRDMNSGLTLRHFSDKPWMSTRENCTRFA